MQELDWTAYNTAAHDPLYITTQEWWCRGGHALHSLVVQTSHKVLLRKACNGVTFFSALQEAAEQSGSR